MSAAIRSTVLFVESIRNVGAHWKLSLVCAVVAFLGGFASVGTAIGSAHELTHVLERQTALGVNAYIVTSSTSDSFPASQCEALRNVGGVESAGARLSVSTVEVASAPGTPISVWEVTPGFVSFVFPDLKPTTGAGLALGNTIAAELGASARGIVTVTPGGERYMHVSGASALAVERIKGANRTVLVPMAANAMVRTCFVEAEPAYKESVGEVLVSWFGPSGNWAVAPLLPPGQFEVDVEDSVRSGPSTWMSPVLGGVTVLVAACLWWSRRQEFALYDLLGLRTRELVSLIALEWIITVFSAALCGGLVALAYHGIKAIEPAFTAVMAAQISVYFLVICAAPAIGFVVVRAVRSADLLKGA